MFFSPCRSSVGLLSLAFLAALAPGVVAGDESGACKCFPGDECWPSTSEWSSFNETLGGKLIATIPLAAVCHDASNTHPDWPAYDEGACSKLQQRWYVVTYPRHCGDVQILTVLTGSTRRYSAYILQVYFRGPQCVDLTSYPDSASTMSPPFVNATCDPFSQRSADCVVGTYVSYSIKVDRPSVVSAGIKFANDNNIRLIIRTSPSFLRWEHCLQRYRQHGA